MVSFFWVHTSSHNFQGVDGVTHLRVCRSQSERWILYALYEDSCLHTPCHTAARDMFDPHGIRSADFFQHCISYATAFEEAKIAATDALKAEAFRRATGFDEPVIYQGKLALDTDGKPLVIRKHSDVLLIFLLKGLDPETFRERYEVTGGGGAPLIPYIDKRLSKLTDEELKTLDELTRRLTAKTDN